MGEDEVRELIALEVVRPRGWLRLIERCCPPGLRRRYGAKDILEDACVRALEALPESRPASRKEFRSWFERHVRNAVRSTRKRAQAKKRCPATESSGRALKSAISADPSPGAIAAARETAEALEKALSGLPPEQATVFRRVRLEDIPVGKAARELGIPPAEASRLLYRAKLRLKAQLAALGLPARMRGLHLCYPPWRRKIFTVEANSSPGNCSTGSR